MGIAVARRTGMAALLAAALLVLWTAPLAAHGSGVLQACVKKANGDMRLVGPGERCHHHEYRVKWNVEGPEGPEGPAGPAGSTATGPPFVWICTPAHYPLSSGSPRADLYVFNASATTANVAVHILDQNGVNLAGATIPGSTPAQVYPGEMGSATVAVAPSATRNLKWVQPETSPEGGPNVSFTIRVVSDQPIAVGSDLGFSGFIPLPCSFLHP